MQIRQHNAHELLICVKSHLSLWWNIAAGNLLFKVFLDHRAPCLSMRSGFELSFVRLAFSLSQLSSICKWVHDNGFGRLEWQWMLSSAFQGCHHQWNVLTENLLLNLKKVAGEVAGRVSCDAVPWFFFLSEAMQHCSSMGFSNQTNKPTMIRPCINPAFIGSSLFETWKQLVFVHDDLNDTEPEASQCEIRCTDDTPSDWPPP